MNTYGRSSGKTYRCVLRVLLAASEGKKVLLICANERMAVWTHAYAIEVCAMLQGMCYVPKRITFPNEGSVTFVGRKVKLKGQKFDKILEDIT